MSDMPEKIWVVENQDDAVQCQFVADTTKIFTLTATPYIRADLAPPSDRGEYKAVADDLDRAHEHIRLYVEAEERTAEKLEKVRDAILDLYDIGAVPSHLGQSAVGKKVREALTILTAIIEKKGA